MNSDKKSFDDARQACIKDGGTLATISDSQEQAFINCKLILVVASRDEINYKYIGLS